MTIPVRALLLLLLCLVPSQLWADPSPRPIPWAKVTEWFVSTLQVRMWGPATLADPQPWTGIYVRVNVSDPYPSPALQPGTWYVADLTPFGVGTDAGQWVGATAAFLSGIEIITGGTSQESAEPDINITFARSDDATADCSKYLGQTLIPNLADVNTGAPIIGGGVRTNMSTMVPLKDGKLKFCFTTTTSGIWPAHPAYGINLTLQAWGH